MSCQTRSTRSIHLFVRALVLIFLVAAPLISCGPGNRLFENGPTAGGGAGGGGGTGGGGGGSTDFVALISGGQTSQTPSPTASAGLYDATANSISATGSMVDPRAYFTLTSLGNGTVLAAGGNTAGAATTAEVFTERNGTFQQINNMNCGHSYHTATMLPIEMVLVAGGSSTACAELFDPSTESWILVGSMTAVRFGAAAAQLSSGLVLFTGGNNASTGGTTTNSAELFNPATALFNVTGNMVTARVFHTATALTSGNVLIAGGENGTVISSTAELFNPASGTFALTGSMTTAREGHTATLLQNGSVLIAGGQTGTGATNSAELYNPTTGTFTLTGSMAVARENGAAVLLPSGNVLIVGGNSSSTECEFYNPTTGQFSTAGNFSPAGSGLAVATLQ